MELCFPTARIFGGAGSISDTAILEKVVAGTDVVAIIDPFLSSTSACDLFRAAVKSVTGSAPRFILAPSKEPDVADVQRVADELSAKPFDTLFAIGGGSAIDTAKAARMCLSNEGAPETVAALGAAMRGHSSRLIAVPTTAGTGSEVTEFAVVNKTGAPIKIAFAAEVMAPYCAILDPDLSVTAPAAVTAASGFDALTHAIEAYVGNRSSAFADALAEDSIRRLVKYLPIAFKEPDSLIAREECLTAACQAGLAFNSAQLGLAHALSAPMGVRWQVAHGVANALALPAVMAFNRSAIGNKEVKLAELLQAENSVDGVARLRFQLGLDLSLDSYLANEADREELAYASLHSKQIANNPRPLDVRSIRAVIEAMRKPIGSNGRELLDEFT